MHQSKIYVDESGVQCKRDNTLSSVPRENVAEADNRIQRELDELRKKVEELSERVRKLENAAVELVDLTKDESFDTTVSVNSDDISPVENGI